ncbi:MAG: UDP-N-acetylmuramate dehydrogenase [Patescibacteria group bacterium]|jgi:UDP-N-acetylmuramate dehydrogenase
MIEELKQRFGAQFKENEPLAKHVNMKIGGPAKFFVEAKSVQDVADAVKLAKENGLKFFVLGGGSNTLVADEGFNGLVIKIAMRNISINGDTVVAEAGAISASVARQTATAGLRGFEWAVSLPGTIGGAVRGNAGCFGGETKDNLVSVKLLREGEVINVAAADLKMKYRHSALKELGNHDVVLEATFKLTPGDKTEALALIDSNLDKRKKTQPLGAASAGCMFKNFEYTDESTLEKLKQDADVPEAMLKSKRLAAGWLIDQAGLKGAKMGDAMVSTEHGNFLMNTGKATASQIAELISLVKMKIRNNYGIQLEEEVQFLG